MERRKLLKLATVSVTLGAPRISRAKEVKPLKFVPIVGLTVLDPSFMSTPHTRAHSYLVYDTLYGLDENFISRPQMVAGHVVEDEGLTWQLTLRDELRFHDGTPVLARDAVASIRRCAVREGFCQALVAATDDLSAPDDRTIRFRLKRPFPHLPDALAGLATITPVIMPERLASGDPARPITEIIGSGPYRFLPSEFVMGERAAYHRFDAYVPRPDGMPSYTSGPKRAYLQRVEWITMDDAATATSALRREDVDWLQAVHADQMPFLAKAPAVRTDVTEPIGSIGLMRFNHLYPPFNNPPVRRALLGAVNQADTMNAVAGTDPRYWRNRVGLFPLGTPLANDAGIGEFTTPHDDNAVRRALSQAGYNGERIVVLGTSGSGYIPALTQVGADALRRVGMDVDLQLSDYATVARRTVHANVPHKGGWNVCFGIAEGAFNHTPATNEYIRGDGKSGISGWMTSPRFEALRQAWLDADSIDEQKRIAIEAQRQLWIDVPYIPMGQWLRVTAYSRDLIGAPWGFAAFYNVRRAA